MGLMLLIVLACSPSNDAVVPSAPSNDAVETIPVQQSDQVGIHEGVQHPPIPADSPAWRHDPGGFVPDVRFYGERSWDGVRMRVAGHIAIIERDRARLYAQQGQYQQAAAVYAALAATLEAMIPERTGPESEIPRMAQQAAERDAALMHALAQRKPTEIGTGLATVRAWLLTHGDKPPASDLQARLVSLIDAATSIQPQPDIDAFADFDDRHQLRVKLWSLYLDAVHPIQFSDPWGYFTWSDYVRTAAGLRAALEGQPPPERESTPFTVEGAGAMPTGDTLIDVAGQPGPKSIGRLERLGLDDPKHRQWLEDTVYVFNSKMKESPGGLLPILDSRITFLDGMGHGSRYYNIKQLRNETLRRLADAGHFRLARQVLSMNYPLHHQDWECPNRNGILTAIDGRLAAIAGDDDAHARLAEARSLSDAFLNQVAEASR